MYARNFALFKLGNLLLRPVQADLRSAVFGRGAEAFHERVGNLRGAHRLEVHHLFERQRGGEARNHLGLVRCPPAPALVHEVEEMRVFEKHLRYDEVRAPRRFCV